MKKSKSKFFYFMLLCFSLMALVIIFMPLFVVYFNWEMPYITYNSISLNIFGLDIIGIQKQDAVLGIFKVLTIVPTYLLIISISRLVKSLL